ncbi:VOC family protein [Candidatus Woesearchaeota archaeon]|nr:VOC family protein [Candidatus Woesearchaeota archaeon]
MNEEKIVPCLWFDNEAEKAAKFYASIFPNSKINEIVSYPIETPSNKPIGSVMTVTFELNGYEFMGLNGGDFFKLNPSISIAIQCETEEEIDKLYENLSKNGETLMPLQNYGFSKKFGWVNDKFGMSWQINQPEDYSKVKQKISPFLLFAGDVCGKAEEAMKFYTSIFKNSKINKIVRYGKDRSPDREGTVEHASFTLEGQEFMVLDSAHEHKFSFNEAFSLIIYCKDQNEVDYFYDKLSAVPEVEICGWLKDKYGVSWQLAANGMSKLMASKKGKETMAAILEMKRLDIKKLMKISEGR